MCASVVAAFVLGEQPVIETTDEETGAVSQIALGHGQPHPEYETMLAGGPGADRHTNILWAGWAFAVFQAMYFVACLAFGMRKKGDIGPAKIPIIIGGVIFFLVFTMLFLTYRTYMNDDDPSLFLSQTKPTAWMVYGVWIFPVFFVFVYRYFFDSWYLTDEDLEKFQSILEENRQAEGDRA